MTKEEMLNAIYDEMADETLSDGCTVRTSDWIIRTIWTASASTTRNWDTIYFGWCWCCEEYDEVWRYTTIWHPVLIGGVIEYIDSLETWLDGKDKVQWRQNVFWLLLLWKNRRLDLTEQSDDCIEFVHNLIKK